jgi:hypothetical protein
MVWDCPLLNGSYTNWVGKFRSAVIIYPERDASLVLLFNQQNKTDQKN